MEFNKLTADEERVIVNKGTEAPFSGKYYKHVESGVYICKRCNSPLYNSEDKFESGCGWPSFDDEIPGAITRIPDADGSRTEIVCSSCKAHLGHVFTGERMTEKNVRHCVNSISLNFSPVSNKEKTETAYFAGGCFWGVEHYFLKENGVLATNVGYMGGHSQNPTYKEVCSGQTGHIETTEVIFDPSKTDFEKLARLFFEIHDPTQIDGQGPDLGNQYKSAIFFLNEKQQVISEKLIKLLEQNGFKPVTILKKADKFWKAEDYHQQYYEHTGKKPYCHSYKKRF
ncbi:MAG: bifunctional methionine sulfoxide reductase B/A protein [Candidatus Riflebacteria bacterium]|nr:bifunctional methionine sulfoxide reductase B/A protein [Candidatus Riflebacteria bacterium]